MIKETWGSADLPRQHRRRLGEFRQALLGNRLTVDGQRHKLELAASTAAKIWGDNLTGRIEVVGMRAQ